MNHLTEEQLIVFHYGEDCGRKDAAAHLAGCDECRHQMEALRTVLAAVSSTPIPEKPEAYAKLMSSAKTKATVESSQVATDAREAEVVRVKKDRSKRLIGPLGGISAIVDAMLLHSNDIAIQIEALAALKLLATSKRIRELNV